MTASIIVGADAAPVSTLVRPVRRVSGRCSARTRPSGSAASGPGSSSPSSAAFMLLTAANALDHQPHRGGPAGGRDPRRAARVAGAGRQPAGRGLGPDLRHRDDLRGREPDGPRARGGHARLGRLEARDAGVDLDLEVGLGDGDAVARRGPRAAGADRRPRHGPLRRAADRPRRRDRRWAWSRRSRSSRRSVSRSGRSCRARRATIAAGFAVFALLPIVGRPPPDRSGLPADGDAEPGRPRRSPARACRWVTPVAWLVVTGGLAALAIRRLGRMEL